MALNDIRCVLGCDTIVGQVDEPQYRGDGFYGMMCGSCGSKKAEARLELEPPVRFSPIPDPLPSPANVFGVAETAACKVQVYLSNNAKGSANNQSQVVVDVDASSTATGITLNGAAAPATVTLASGSATVSVAVSGAGSVVLKLVSATHPLGNKLELGTNLPLEFV